MAKIANNLTELIGGTPLMKLAGYSQKYGLQREVVAKLESFNPAGSVKAVSYTHLRAHET